MPTPRYPWTDPIGREASVRGEGTVEAWSLLEGTPRGAPRARTAPLRLLRLLDHERDDLTPAALAPFVVWVSQALERAGTALSMGVALTR